MTSYCCTCAAPLLAGIPITPAAPVTPKDAKTASPQHRQLPCCDRFVCSRCLTQNARFATYCPFCQIATAPPPSSKTMASATSDLLPPGLKAPPPYRRFGAGASTSADAQPSTDEAPPPYSTNNAPNNNATSSPSSPSSPSFPSEKDAGPVLHYLDHDRDSIASLSLRYNVPAAQLRQANRLAADHLLQARRVIQIPSSAHAALTSLSPQPVESEAEGRRKAAIRRFMVACKVSDYDLAVLYLEQTAWRGEDAELGYDYDLRAAVEAFQADEQWERSHPVEAAKQKADARRKKAHKNSGTDGRVGGFFSRRRS
ncbi:uncharacterized protein SPSK_02667 [Sporothrix schenckii 1099-18]|uniref:LysM domain-containing protein n=1 Tax=Sporothrix schenckii 1099-18 TaxID=1397361 RepID=A0A0F2MC39_SPOSC|nr:uncharacterized protein SPSK_02667 [Sporothrix schenckii 1099-18]KJR86400.1 hypothetical protein SPSK_02667 [Sporothrix schenckii 1099-18]